MVEPRAPEDQLAQPVGERVAVEAVELPGVRGQVAPEPAAGVVDPAGAGELDQVGGLVEGEVARGHELEPYGGSSHPLLEVGVGEPVAVVEELDHIVVPGHVLELGMLCGRLGVPHMRTW